MKYFTYKILVAALLALPVISFGQTDSLVKKSRLILPDSQYLTGTDNFLISDNFSDADLQKIMAIHRMQQGCPNIAPGDCSDFCDRPECIAKILKCHEIQKEDFDLMTEKMMSGHARFRKGKVRKVVKRASCQTQHIRFLINADKTYIMARVNSRPALRRGPDNEAFYSVALLQGIFKKKIKSITLYRGISIPRPHTTDQVIKIVPFMVTFSDGSVGYFDVSETQP